MALPPVFSNYPTFVQVLYRSSYGLHIQTLKLREWIVGADLGAVPRWSDDTPIEVAGMLSDFLDLEALTVPATTNFTLAKLYTKTAPDAPAVLRRVFPLDIDGASVASGWSKAVQLNLNGFDTDGHPCRLSVLDAQTGNDFNKLYTGGISAAALDMWEAFSSDGNGWSSQAGFKPESLISQTATLNEKLRREYGLA